MRSLEQSGYSRLFLILLFFLATKVQAQENVTGTIASTEGEALVGATVQWLATGAGTTTDEAGSFALPFPEDRTDTRLMFSYVGFASDTIEIGDFYQGLWIELKPEATLQEVTVEGQRSGAYIDDRVQKVEVISEVELTRAACCDLAGCFNTESSVRSQTTNIVTNVRELQILGLSGVYNQLLLDGLPMFQGANYTYGLSSLPGPWIRNIYVSKGANSVLQGYESISGQINVETKEPLETNPLFFNAYINSFGEKQFNAMARMPLSEESKIQGSIGLHATLPAGRFDRDDDNFLDLPLLERYALINNWSLGDQSKPGFSALLSLRGWKENRVGGQEDFRTEEHEGGMEVFGQTVDLLHGEASLKTAYRFDEKNVLSLQNAFQAQEQTAWFGPTRFQADQQYFYSNLQFEHQSKRFTSRSGLSFRRLNLDQGVTFSTNGSPFREISAPAFGRESTVGLFTENTIYGPEDRWALITGLRLDHNNYFDWQLSPRALFRYNFGDGTSARASIGRGWRTVRPLSDYVQAMASNRNIFSQISLPESAWNGGVNITHRMQVKNAALTLSGDFYHTRFTNQIFPDYERIPGAILFQDFDGKSVSNSLQLEARATFSSLLEARIGYNYLNVYRNIDGENVQLPFIPEHKITAAASYQPDSRRWQIDGNVHWYGRQRLPNTEALPEALQQPTQSETYATLDLQFTYRLKSIEIYTGVENLFDFRQLRPLVSWQDPFSPWFDTSFAWGPTRGRELYIGIRYKIE